MASSTQKVLVFAGSAREASLNKQLAKLGAKRIEALGGEATFIDLKDYPCPLFDEDIETQGMPENVVKLREILAEHQGVLIASPEYNGFITPLLKNTLDWLSRPYQETPGLGLFAGKWAALVGASPGGLGGIRALPLGQQLLANLGLIVLPQPLSLPKAGSAFNDSGALNDAATGQKLDALCQRLVDVMANNHP
ncbi:NADPH-dependent FMN reductase [Vreelandella neptunia]|uniref:NAD(P)H-dependent oxidoreductase n=1 Tax=Vreelandella neptunia TaxID=115551 RepID=A0ABS9S751_9GAMM|nr:NADPH-dependent FMN reductase [Halomonas neptunia]MCH4811946.1 NAD(P)H-dependent oxidoreductase [Halomonas neptunia]